MYGNSAVFHADFTGPLVDIMGQMEAPWWLAIKHACWARPTGVNSAITHCMDHPVVHVSHGDALAYCVWADRALPTEAQWEYAARGGLEAMRYPWGNALLTEGKHHANLWQGTFPTHNEALDGFATLAPVKTYQPNGFGLWQMAGNTWEWCNDWFSARTYDSTNGINPIGPKSGKKRVIRGGSFLCHNSYCNRYRVAARSSAPPDSSASNVGFRTISLQINTIGS